MFANSDDFLNDDESSAPPAGARTAPHPPYRPHPPMGSPGIGSGGQTWVQASNGAMAPAPPGSSRPWSSGPRPTSARGRTPTPSSLSATYHTDPFGNEDARARPPPPAPGARSEAIDRLQQQKALQERRRQARTMGGVSAAQRPTRPGGAAGSPLPAAMGVGPPAIGGSMGAPTIGAVSSAMGGMSLERPSSGGGWRAANSPGAAAPSAITGTTSAFAATSIGAGAGGEMGAFVRDRAASMRGGDALETFDAAAAAAAPAASAPGSRAREVQAEMLQQGMAPVYDPSTAAAGGVAGGQEADGAEVGAASAGTRERKRPPAANLDLSDIRHFLLQPGPMDGPVQCTIRRMRTDRGSKSHPSYSLYLEPQGGAGGRTEFTFLLSGRKRKKKGGANYMISLDEDDQARDSGNYFGKVRGNFLGTQFVCYDKGANPKKADESLNVSQFGARQELGVVNYQHNVLGMRGPRKMTVAIPSVDQAGRRAIFKPDTKGKGSLVEAMERNDENNMIVMTNKAPKWNEKENAWCLNFNGRVSKASVKNFQLVSDADQEHIIVQFGKTGEDTFTMDYQWPCSALQAFAICLTSFDSKLACE